MTNPSFEEAAMNGKTGIIRGPRRAGPLAVVAAVAVLATACGTSAPSTSGAALGGSVTVAQEISLTHCMRGHGLPDFPGPSASGGFNLTTANGSSGAVDPDTSQFQTAYGACRHLLAGDGPSVGQLQQDAQQEQQALQKALPALLKYSQCMRSHGLPTFPDPTANGLDLDGSGINPSSPQFQTATSACQSVLPAGMHTSQHSSQQSRSS
jgi:hypothetical protein